MTLDLSGYGVWNLNRNLHGYLNIGWASTSLL